MVSISSSTPIQLLDESTINKIAAGEVIERPASVVKELLENSIDAKSTKIRVDIEGGGLRRIRIQDNGWGISKEGLALAPVRHATSKIRQVEDIYTAPLMGFRGEALASIAHVADLRIKSRHIDSENGYEVHVLSEGESVPKPASHPVGTSITVDGLFSKVPVRRKYLKSPATEFSYCLTMVQHAALARPDLDFIVAHDGEEVFNSTGISELPILMARVFGKTLNDKLIEIDVKEPGANISGWISDPTVTFSNRTRQVIIVNGRVVQSGVVQKIIMDVYRDVIPHRRFASFVLRFDMDPAEVDVNVHPRKLEVKFLNPQWFFQVLPKVLRAVLRKEHGIQHAAGLMPQSPGFPQSNDVGFQSLNTNATQLSWQGPAVDYSDSAGRPGLAETMPQGDLFSSQEITTLQDNELEYLQFFDTYIVVKARDSMWILDQHAVHERVLYEQFKKDRDDKSGDIQPLLISEVVDLGSDLKAVFLEVQSIIKGLGFVCEDFGDTRVVIRQVPAVFQDMGLADWLMQVLEDLKSHRGATDLNPDQKEGLQMKACKAAIKAGRRLLAEEVRQLVKDFLAAPSNFTCPHGRPLFVSFSKIDLEKLFLRR
ncbi:DNA mismatch repair endonuclease MutL [bacterium]|jgi:DNA mismatch repair protein MutL|nr:DNA mismatch repair endonuclease MutL [bacterium]